MRNDMLRILIYAAITFFVLSMPCSAKIIITPDDPNDPEFYTYYNDGSEELYMELNGGIITADAFDGTKIAIGGGLLYSATTHFMLGATGTYFPAKLKGENTNGYYKCYVYDIRAYASARYFLLPIKETNLNCFIQLNCGMNFVVYRFDGAGIDNGIATDISLGTIAGFLLNKSIELSVSYSYGSFGGEKKPYRGFGDEYYISAGLLL